MSLTRWMLVLCVTLVCLPVPGLAAEAASQTPSLQGGIPMSERSGLITFKGGPLTLLGDDLPVGQKVPDFTLLANDLSPVKLADTKGVRVFTTVPSLDTPVCDLQVKRFNEEAGKLLNVSIFAVSADLPFAQARWCGGAGVKNLKTLSDHRDMAFAKAWGVWIKELRLLARAVFVVDSQGVLLYKELVKEVTTPPNYDAALEALKKAR